MELEEAGNEKVKVSEKGEKILATLFYTFISQVMPPVIYDHLQETIESAIRCLEGTHPLPLWIRFDQNDHNAMLSALKLWKTEVIKQYPSKDFVDNALAGHLKARMALAQYGVPTDHMLDVVPQGCRSEFKDYFKTGLLLPPQFALDVKLRAIINAPESDSRYRDIRNHVEATWKPNVTLADLSYLRQGIDLFDVGHNPAELATHLYGGCIWQEPKNPKKLYDYARPFFFKVAHALAKIGDRLIVEALSGDITFVLDKIQTGRVKNRDGACPTKCDRIHLSNIP